MQHQRHLVDVARRRRAAMTAPRARRTVGDLGFQVASDRAVGAAHDDVGLDARLRSSVTECWVGLVFCSPDGADVRHQRDVHVEHVLAADVLAELPDRLEERQDLDVADGAADLGDHDVDVVVGVARGRRLISSVMCGMTCTVLPR